MTQLQRWRLVRGLSQDQLAALVRCSKSAISQYEHGINKPRFPVCDRLAHVQRAHPRFLRLQYNRRPRVRGDRRTERRFELIGRATFWGVETARKPKGGGMMALNWQDEVVTAVVTQRTPKKRPHLPPKMGTSGEAKRGATVGSVALYLACVLGMMALAAWPPR